MPPPALDSAAVLRVPPIAERLKKTVLVVALDAGRKLVPLLRDGMGASGQLHDVILEEWALSKDELPEGADLEKIRVLHTKKGNLDVPDGVETDLVLFVDSYHRLWDSCPH